MRGPALDPAVLESLRQLTSPGEPDVLKEVLELFLEDVPRRIERIRSSWQTGNAAELHRAAHSLKGSAGNIGAHELLDVCRQLDDLGRAGDVTGARPLIEALDAAYARVVEQIRRLSADDVTS
jgi:HPt (histidine-containing phosphotransfer) domain-containing protein